MYIFFSLCLLTMVGLQVYIQYRDAKQRKFEFDLKLEAAKASASSHINTMKYTDLIAILDTNMKYYVNQAVLVSGIVETNSDEQRSLLINDLLVSVCVQIDTSLSNKVKDALLNYVSDEYLHTYIKDGTRILLIAKIEEQIIKKRRG